MSKMSDFQHWAKKYSRVGDDFQYGGRTSFECNSIFDLLNRHKHRVVSEYFKHFDRRRP